MIIGYIHICQKGEWLRSLKMIFDKIKESGLYDIVNEIRVGILNYSLKIDHCDIFNDPKINIIYIGHPDEYERPTLLHMRKSSETENNYCIKYFYCHTKGLRWFGTDKEKNVVDWIKLLIYWNINKWKNAINILNDYDTYGCNFYKENQYNPSHYSGNFFWVNSSYLKILDQHIGNEYNDPEFWLCRKNGSFYNAYSSGLEGMGHYDNEYPEENYLEI
uniref:Uncharacterized protein n=1 Tax=viral metagenome TaxID=1070528 RepID=A0A6C0CVG4_9ZZZZ